MGWHESFDAWLLFLRIERNRSPRTLENYARDLGLLQDFALEAGIPGPEQFTDEHAQSFLVQISHTYSGRSQARVLSAVKGFFSFLCEEEDLPANPFVLQRGPHFNRPLPGIFSEDEIRVLLEAIDTSNPRGIRDHALIVLLYSTGLRVSELVGLKTADLDFQRNVLFCIGKRNKMRYVPFGRIARQELENYLANIRSVFTGRHPDCPWVFPGRSGKPMTRQGVWKLLGARARAAGLERALSPHKLRHSFATVILENGGDVRAVQAMLGHADLSTTQMYTHVVTKDLVHTHAKHHPRG